MNIVELKQFLAWSTAINYGALLLWFGVFVLGHAWLYRLHTRWFKLSVERFDALHYAGMAIYKIGVLLFNVVPLLVLFIVS
jgi:hypothetical protein